jgi:tetratricopeptide (TPR) repeat protein
LLPPAPNERPATDPPSATVVPIPADIASGDGGLSAPPSSSQDPLLTSPRRAPVEIVPVDFNGVVLGDTTLDEAIELWGKPIERTTEKDMVRCRFKIEPFAGVDTAFVGGKVQSIVVDLGRPFAPDAVARELGIEGLTPVEVRDETGRPLGLVYPERGVSLRFDDGAAERRVSFIGMDKIDVRPFVLRAEQAIDQDYEAAAGDLEAALKLEADTARALWLKARLLQGAGRNREALAAVEHALRLEPRGAEYLLTRAALLAEAGLFAAALDDTQAVIEGTTGALHLQARAWSLRGDLLADGPDRDYGQALDAHTRAIRLAEPLATDKRLAVRRSAKETLIEAHLGAAEDIAWGDWKDKDKIAAKWLDKARRLADQWSQAGDVGARYRLAVRRQGAACCVGLQGAGDPSTWANELLTIREVIEAAGDDDPPRRRQEKWECGLGLYDALQAYHTRGEIAESLRCGEAAVELLTAGREGRDERPTDAYMFGRLYFRIGSIYAVRKQDHEKAVAWFERAAPLLERPLPDAVAADRGRQGETLVSMGVSYWAVGKRERAMQLTDAGCRYMQTAVADGSLTTVNLAVPYANLAAMHRQLGDDVAGKRYAEMATRVETGGGVQRR